MPLRFHSYFELKLVVKLQLAYAYLACIQVYNFLCILLFLMTMTRNKHDFCNETFFIMGCNILSC